MVKEVAVAQAAEGPALLPFGDVGRRLDRYVIVSHTHWDREWHPGCSLALDAEGEHLHFEIGPWAAVSVHFGSITE